MNREKELVKNTFILFIGTFLPKFAALVTIPVITSHLTRLEYGSYDLLQTLVTLLLPIATLQIQAGAFRFLIDCRDNEYEKKSVITNIYAVLIPISLIVLAILFAMLSEIEFLTRILIVLYYFVDIVFVGTQQVVRGLSYNKLYSLSSVVQSSSNMILVILLVSLGNLGLNGVLISFAAATAGAIAVLARKAHLVRYIDLRTFSKEKLSRLLKYSWPMIPNSLSAWILDASDRLILTSFLGLETTAVYGVAYKIPSLFTSVQGTFIYAWQENASLAIKDGDAENYYSVMFENVLRILTGIMALLICFSPFLFSMLIRGDYDESYAQIPILFIGVYFSGIASFLGGIFIAHKRTRNVGITTIGAAIINLLLDLLLVNKCGIYAASVSTLVSYAALSIFRILYIKKFQRIRYHNKLILNCIAVLSLMCLLCWINTWLSILLNIMIGITFGTVINQKLLNNVFRALRAKIHPR